MIVTMIHGLPQRRTSMPINGRRSSPEYVLYFDNNATTKPAPNVVGAISRVMEMLPGNASSSHVAGRDASDAIERARSSLALALDAQAREVVFTSGATESNNLALGGIARVAAQGGSAYSGRRRVLIGATEHPSVLAAAAALRHQGLEVEYIPVDHVGLHDLDYLKDTLSDDVLLVSVMLANNETGVVSSLMPIVRAAKDTGALFHCDATQAVGRLPVSFADLGVDLMALSAHKFYGPKGVGALVVRRGLALLPTQHGGDQERGLRAGTLNTPGIVGLGVAAEAVPALIEDACRIAVLRDLLVDRLIQSIPGTTLVAAKAARLPNTANLRFPGADADAVLSGMPTVAASTGAACASGRPEPSHVLLSMDLGSKAASECVRFSLSIYTTPDEVHRLVALTQNAVQHVRSLTGVEE